MDAYFCNDDSTLSSKRLSALVFAVRWRFYVMAAYLNGLKFDVAQFSCRLRCSIPYILSATATRLKITWTPSTVCFARRHRRRRCRGGCCEQQNDDLLLQIALSAWWIQSRMIITTTAIVLDCKTPTDSATHTSDTHTRHSDRRTTFWWRTATTVLVGGWTADDCGVEQQQQQHQPWYIWITSSLPHYVDEYKISELLYQLIIIITRML